mmetsp:Transcript_19878/g.24537  ORF Transcript_19878/g.24537 Transcript_19878/m.24537 type:complete len:332 (-) Transcript_19878:280-1275(-)|eukprot:CAMPEP_0172497334 /NCGR_PEP_ID=MMETSP1066-20121228/98353_1 /TAXON_ID=671091 /ORGANISM="Coscinodiscus wailesii, Strain CCMP2513" /LENGTH=331 /DNA_ID=CAMNT_0013270035 /DNA_START=80 /DNA_END=1075 /DNA_ORIENTATION=+
MPQEKKKKHPIQHLLAGGIAGLIESSCCHPLDTIKTRMQLRRQATAVASARPLSSFSTPKHVPRGTVMAPLGPIGTAKRIVRREGFTALYKGLTAVYTGIVPKMAIRFVSFETYRDYLANVSGGYSNGVTFIAGLMSGLTEAILVVTPAEVCKIRMQAQYHSMMDPAQMTRRKYRNVVQTAGLIVKEEGLGALYKGVAPTMIRQGVNQSVNFTVYQWGKKKLIEWKGGEELYSWETLLMGGFSGAFGPMVNNPLDVVKTRIQRQVIVPGHEPQYKGMVQSCMMIGREEGPKALWKGLTPRLMRIVPGQAITFMTYEAVSSFMNKKGMFPAG